MRLRVASLLISFLLPLSAAAAEDSKLLSVDPAMDHIRGSKDAQASMIVYSDFECPFCKRFHPVVDQVRKAFPQVRIVYRNFPLSSIHPNALPSAKAAECVAQKKGNDAYWSFIDDLFAEEELSAANLRALAMKQGLSDAEYDACSTDKAVMAKIEADIDSGTLAEVNGTPTSFLINPEGTAFRVMGAVDFATIEKKLRTFKLSEKQDRASSRIKTTKRKARVREAITVKGVRRWK